MHNEDLWAPWRMAYLRELERRAEQVGWSDVSAGGFLAAYWAAPEQDEANHVVHRDDDGLIVLNRYPYANGHMLVALGAARPTLLAYEPQQRAAFWRLVEVGMEIMQRTLAPQGINMGINEGRAAGAGAPEHLHAHLVPRWAGDTNFMSTIGNVRVIPDSLTEMAARYRATATSG